MIASPYMIQLPPPCENAIDALSRSSGEVKSRILEQNPLNGPPMSNRFQDDHLGASPVPGGTRLTRFATNARLPLTAAFSACSIYPRNLRLHLVPKVRA